LLGALGTWGVLSNPFVALGTSRLLYSMYHAQKFAVKTEIHVAKITIYQKPTCSTCRQAVQILRDSGHPFETVNYYDKPFTKSQLKTLLQKAGLTARDILRTKEDLYKTLGLAKKTLADDDLLALMVKHPDLIQRPILEKGDNAILARPAETVKEFFSGR
jgi:arsenate reductase